MTTAKKRRLGMTPDQYWLLRYRPVTLLIKTIHLDKAGETSSVRRVPAEVADVDDQGTVLLVTRTGVPVTLSVSNLYPKRPPETRPDKQSYLAGHELFRNFHPHRHEPYVTRRWLDRDEIDKLLAEVQRR
jgi:hypothetical protein